MDGKPIGYGKIKAAYFEYKEEPIYAIHFGEGKGAGYYDQEGKSLQKAFLKEPLEYTRISSRYSLKRFHPVQKRFKAHLGTDFAAPRGTPIRSVGNGLVLEAGFSRGNGNYVKIKHDNIYTTQYLHMSRFAKGIRKGSKVTIGQTIGYVGSTGLAAGAHLCYRFWKNGKQVDVLREKLPLARSIEKEHKAQFEQERQELMNRLNKTTEEEPVVVSQEDAPAPATNASL
jgi:murein DD-endopeptidase MepM/ murein hydrolase activator NlpD